MDRLSAPVNHIPSKLDLKLDPSLRYTTYSDAKNCRFRPITVAGVRRKKLQQQQSEQSSADSNKKEDPKFSFLNRMEQEEMVRRAELQTQIKKQEYDLIVDKKVCPKCGCKKSYDEVKEKKKQCPRCKVDYGPAVDWAKISKSFFRKEKEYAQRSQELLQQKQKELEEERTFASRPVLDTRTGSTVELRAPLKQQLTKEDEKEFFDRMEEKLLKKQQKIKSIEKEMYSETCSFRPSLLSTKSVHSLERDGRDLFDDEEDEARRDAFQSFLNRCQEDLLIRKEKFPEKYSRFK